MKKTLWGFILVGCIAAVFYGLYFLQVNRDVVKKYRQEAQAIQLVVDDEWMTGSDHITYVNDRALINIQTVQHIMPDAFRIAPSRKRILFSTSGLHFNWWETLKPAWLEASDFEINLPLHDIQGQLYVDLADFEPLMGIEVESMNEKIILRSKRHTRLIAYTKEGAKLTQTEGKTDPAVKRFESREKVMIYKTLDDHFRVVTEEGYVGYLLKDQVKEVVEVPLSLVKPSKIGDKPTYGKLNMTWDALSDYKQVVEGAPDQKIKGLDVLMPTVFKLTSDGWVLNNMDHHYMAMAKTFGYKVHALFDNQFDPELTHDTLKDPLLVQRVIDQLVFYTLYYELQGINIDFENVYLEDQGLFTAFIEQLALQMAPYHLTLSIDVTRPGGSETWSKFLDRKALAKHVDYVILMAYDQFWANSPLAGSVATLPWTEESIQLTLEEVPKEKLILGIPTYMRVWEEKTGDDQSVSVTSSALSMANYEAFVSQHITFKSFDEEAMQNFVEIEKPDENTRLKIWVEDLQAVERRLRLVKKYDLQGVSHWRKGFELEAYWPLVDHLLEE